MSDIELTPDQQAVMDDLKRDAKSAKYRLASPWWRAKNERRAYLIDKELGDGLDAGEIVELESLQKAIDVELGMIDAPSLYDSAIRLARFKEEMDMRAKQKGGEA